MATSSCGFGLSDYELESTTEDDAGALPPLPALPDESRRPECEACVEVECSGYREACLVSQECRDMLRCQGRCDSPGCIMDCANRLPRSLVFEDYFACAFRFFDLVGQTTSSCAETCGSGLNWECAGNYSWPRPVGIDNPPTLITLRDTVPGTGGPLAVHTGVEVGSCNPFMASQLASGDEGCGGFALVDGYGLASLTLSGTSDIFAVREIPGAPIERLRVYGAPIVRPGPGLSRQYWVLPSGSIVDALKRAYLPERDVAKELVWFDPVDCLMQLASDVRIELRPPGVSQRGYWASGLDTTVDKGAAGIFWDVTPGASLEIVGSMGEREVARRLIGVAPGWTTYVLLLPTASRR